MAENVAGYACQYGGYLLEALLLWFLLWRAQSRRLAGLAIYIGLLLGVDGLARPYVLYAYGFRSHEYTATFWLTDVLLQLAAFLLVCSFFRVACAGQEEKMWQFVRLLLIFVFIIVLGISLISLSQNYSQLFTRFMIEFEQNLYFTCLVLTTLLYLLMQQTESADEQLGLLVCGMGIQFAGPAASLALRYLTPGQPYSESLVKLIMPLCTFGMLLIWLYAITRVLKSPVMAARAKAPELRHVAVSKA